jgi:rod shape-determining protein MreD
MNYFIYITCGLFMVICQTTVIPRLAFVGYLFDLVLPVVIYLAAFRPLREALPFTVFLGVLMDHLSGGPFGLYLTSYVWLFVAARAAATVVRAENPIMIVVILIIAVATQNALFFAILGASGLGHFSGSFALRVVTEQIGWVLLVGPFLAWGIRGAHRYSSKRARKITIEPSAN